MKTLLLMVCMLAGVSASGQSFAEWEEVLDDYCQEHFSDCFGAEYESIMAVADVDYMTESHVILRGDLVCTEDGAGRQQETFQADVRFFRDHITVQFRRQPGSEESIIGCERRL